MDMLCDMTGKELKEGQIVNVFFTSNNGEFVHDIKCKVVTGVMGDIQLHYLDLMWELGGRNQYPLNTTFAVKYDSLDYEWNYEFNKWQLIIPDSYGLGRKWKSNDKSKYIRIIS